MCLPCGFQISWERFDFFIMSSILVASFSLLGLARTEIQLTRKECYQKKAFYAAEAGLEYGIAKLKQLLSEQGQFVDLDDGEDIAVVYNIAPPVLEGFTYDEFSIIKVGVVEAEVISSGPYNGMNSLTQKFKITSHATSDTMESAEVSLVQWVEDQNIPLFQFAVIYDQDLQLEPGPPMTINGRIHTNGHIYLESGSTMSISQTSAFTFTSPTYPANPPLWNTWTAESQSSAAKKTGRSRRTICFPKHSSPNAGDTTKHPSHWLRSRGT